LSGTDEGIKSRLLLVPFNVTIPKEERDMKLADKLAPRRAASSTGCSMAFAHGSTTA
jgi:phage/plasmid-associated DNA primase